MVTFLGVLGLFLLAHSAPTIPSVRRRLTGLLGERGYLALYVTASLALLAALIWSAGRAPVVPLWFAGPWMVWLTVLVTLPAFMLIGAGLAHPNALSVSLAGAPAVPGAGPAGVSALTRHPVLWGFGLWSLAHGAVNGTLVHAILFGGFAAFSFAGMGLVDGKRRRILGLEAWQAHEAARRVAGIGAVFSIRTLAGASAGLAFYAVFLFWAHEALIGVSPRPPF